MHHIHKKGNTVVIVIVVIIAIAALVALVTTRNSASPGTSNQNATSTEKAKPETSQVEPSTKQTVVTDASLEADVAAIDGNLKGLESDSASVDTSVNDKPVGQEP